MTKKPNYLTTCQAAEKLLLSEARVRQYCREGRIGVRFGRIYLIPEKQLSLVRNLPTGRPKNSPKKASAGIAKVSR
jgi:hypothetical protein